VHEQRTYTDEEPVLEQELEIELDPVDLPIDPIQEFLQSLDSERTLTLHVFVHPNFAREGKIGSKTDRVFVTSFAFTPDETETYRQRTQYCYPQGGMFSFELRERGAIVRRWEEQLSAVPGHEPPKTNNGYPFPPPPAVTIRMPEQQKAEAQLSPIQVVKEQLSTMRDMVGIVKDLMPPAPVVNVGESHPAPDRPIEDRLFETVLLKALDSGKAPIDKVIDALSGRSAEKPGFMDSLGPMFSELIKALAPAISMGVQQYVRASGGPVPNGQPGEPAPVAEVSALPPVPPDPAERAWRRVVQRLLEDCFEHVRIREVSAEDGINPATNAGAIVDLLDRFPDQLQQMIETLLNLPPDEVVDMCAMLQPTPQLSEEVMRLKTFPAALSWLAELQVESKRILATEELAEA